MYDIRPVIIQKRHFDCPLDGHSVGEGFIVPFEKVVTQSQKWDILLVFGLIVGEYASDKILKQERG